MDTGRLVLNGGIYFDSINGKLIENQTIVAKNNTINWIGHQGEFEKEENDKILNVDGNYILPGLFDCHVHLDMTFEFTQNWVAQKMRVKDPMYSYIALKSSQDYIKYGFTTLRDCGGHKWGASLRRVFAQRMFSGPRLLVAQNPIAQWGNQEAMGPDHFIKADERDEVISGPDGVTHTVRERKRSGSDFIKTMTTGGVLHGMESKIDQSLWTINELQAMVTEAERLGMYVAAHAHGNEGIYQAALAGVRTMEHCSMPSEDTLKLMKQKNTYIVGTHSPEFLIKNEQIAKKLNPEIVEKGKMVLTQRTAAHRLAYEMGVQIALGTDAPIGDNHCHSAKELSLMSNNIGMTNEDVLRSASIIAAKAVKLDDRLGSIEIGKLADLVVLSKNPLEKLNYLENTQNIDYVIKEGIIVSKKGILE